MTAPVDIGIQAAETAKTVALAKMDEFGLARPGLVLTTAGAGIPITDGCEGMLWARVDTVYPTNGSGDPFAAARPGFGLPAWAFPIHLGILWCHDVIDYEGYAPDAARLAEFAHRDAQYRAALYTGLVEDFPTAAQQFAEGWRVAPWAPFGPEGGLSGGSLLITVISNYLVC